MASPPPFTGYRARFEMPIIAPPPESFAGLPGDYYQQLEIDLVLAVSGPNDEFADFTVAKGPSAVADPDPTLFAVTGGFISCYPAGSLIPSPDGFVDAVNNVLVLTVWADDADKQRRTFPPDMPVLSRIYYVGIDAVATTAILRVQTARMTEAALRVSWRAAQNSAAPADTTLDALIDAHNDRVMAGDGSVFIDGGTPVGAAAEDLAAPVKTFGFTLRVTGGGPPIDYFPPLPLFVGAPNFDL